MKSHFVVRNAEEWQALKELPVPVVSDKEPLGLIRQVLKVGFVPATREQLPESLRGLPDIQGRVILPTIVVERLSQQTFLRLPLSLAPWVYDCVALASDGANSFPSPVEFGIREGSTYAEFCGVREIIAAIDVLRKEEARLCTEEFEKGIAVVSPERAAACAQVRRELKELRKML